LASHVKGWTQTEDVGGRICGPKTEEEKDAGEKCTITTFITKYSGYPNEMARAHGEYGEEEIRKQGLFETHEGNTSLR
jgi:hypothetical protein